ncbi:hypothetical protein [Duganella sacchari]|uniref:hypothetical protein n=1 Tax=Duganella sacchari TaxID=551987 RepID=UPI001114CA29|nr:hypothetical protein [Duganella sacchari]
MKITFNVVLLALVTMLVSCGHRQEISRLSIEVRPNSFIVDGREFHTSAELTAALAKYPPLQNIYLKNQPGVTRARIDETLAAMHDAKIEGSIGLVGNEIFN